MSCLVGHHGLHLRFHTLELCQLEIVLFQLFLLRRAWLCSTLGHLHFRRWFLTIFMQHVVDCFPFTLQFSFVFGISIAYHIFNRSWGAIGNPVRKLFVWNWNTIVLLALLQLLLDFVVLSKTRKLLPEPTTTFELTHPLFAPSLFMATKFFPGSFTEETLCCCQPETTA